MNIPPFKDYDTLIHPETELALDDHIQAYYLEMCCCGDPEANLSYIHGALLIVNMNVEKDEEWGDFFERRKAQITYHFKTQLAENFMWYWLDSEDLIEHGSILPGWLTEKGLNLLAWLEKARDVRAMHRMVEKFKMEQAFPELAAESKL